MSQKLVAIHPVESYLRFRKKLWGQKPVFFSKWDFKNKFEDTFFCIVISMEPKSHDEKTEKAGESLKKKSK